MHSGGERLQLDIYQMNRGENRLSLDCIQLQKLELSSSGVYLSSGIKRLGEHNGMGAQW